MPRVTTVYDDDILERLATVAKRMSQPGVLISRSDAVRAAVLRGTTQLEQELGIPTPKEPKR